jgi:hypothetical protein
MVKYKLLSHNFCVLCFRFFWYNVAQMISFEIFSKNIFKVFSHSLSNFWECFLTWINFRTLKFSKNFSLVWFHYCFATLTWMQIMCQICIISTRIDCTILTGDKKFIQRSKYLYFNIKFKTENFFFSSQFSQHSSRLKLSFALFFSTNIYVRVRKMFDRLSISSYQQWILKVYVKIYVKKITIRSRRKLCNTKELRKWIEFTWKRIFKDRKILKLRLSMNSLWDSMSHVFCIKIA